MEHFVIAQGRHGQFLCNRNDSYVSRSLQLYGEWSEAEVFLFGQILRPGDVVLEAGANIGSHTVFLSRAVGDSGEVHAFEAARHTHQLLCANLALNERFNVRALHQAIGRGAATVDFPLLDPRTPSNFGSASLRCAAQAAAVEPVSMRSIDELNLSRLDFIKSDIEGHEGELLAGATATLQRCRPVVYLEINNPDGTLTGNRDELVGALEREGYACYYFIAPMFNPQNFLGASENVFHAASVDMICVPQEKACVEGLTQAHVADTAIRFAGNTLHYAALPWSDARFKYL